MMKSGLQTAEAMLMATIKKKKKETPFILKNLRRLHYAVGKIKTMKREYVKATNGVLVLNMRFAFLSALSRMLMKLLLQHPIDNTEESEEVRKGEWK
ncbi:hypothetical protein Godav_002106, partial [Gossypium davidsonii]|nr:hypothetical protein [Gossypium davidsonii]